MRRTKQEKIFYYSQSGIYKKKLLELENTEQKVIWLLKYYPHLRDCDLCLIKYFHCQVDQWQGGLLKEDIHSLTPEETITRCRRYIQNTLGLYLPTQEEVIEARKINEVAVRNWAINNLK